MSILPSRYIQNPTTFSTDTTWVQVTNTSHLIAITSQLLFGLLLVPPRSVINTTQSELLKCKSDQVSSPLRTNGSLGRSVETTVLKSGPPSNLSDSPLAHSTRTTWPLLCAPKYSSQTPASRVLLPQGSFCQQMCTWHTPSPLSGLYSNVTRKTFSDLLFQTTSPLCPALIPTKRPLSFVVYIVCCL